MLTNILSEITKLTKIETPRFSDDYMPIISIFDFYFQKGKISSQFAEEHSVNAVKEHIRQEWFTK